MNTLYNQLKEIVEKEKFSAHMPGHANAYFSDFSAYAIDTTELDTTDNLFRANGLLKKSQEELAQIYQADSSRYLVGGSSAGLMATIMALVNEGDKVIVPFDAHKSVYNALSLAKADVIRILPEYGISHPLAYSEESYLQEITSEIKLVIITTPNYYGFVTDVRAIADKVRDCGATLLVDEAHGAHLNFVLPELSALNASSAIVVQSTHKTLPALTQTAILHYKNIDEKIIERVDLYLQILQTSSPSYVLMASIDLAVKTMAESKEKLIVESLLVKRYIEDNFAEFLEDKQPHDFYKLWLNALKFGYDGDELASYLISKGIYAELNNQYGVLLYLTPQTTLVNLESLKRILEKLPRRKALNYQALMVPRLPKKRKELSKKILNIDLELVKGYYIAEDVIPYPPGAPLLLKGDYIDEYYYEQLISLKNRNVVVLGVADSSLSRIKVYEKS